MNRCQPYCQMNPLTGIWPAYENAISYRYVSPDGDEGRNNQHLGAHYVSATMPPRCNGATITLHSPFLILNWSHTFSAKEKDSETGLSYFGARYYSSDLSIWLSVDPMSDKYPSLSPYVYCANNPVKLVDPNGEEVGDYYSFNGTYLGSDGKNDNKLYQQSENGDVIYGLGVLNKPTFEYVGEVDETALKYEGKMYEKKDGDPNFTGSISVGKLTIVQKVGEKEFVKDRYDVLSGGWGNGSIQNGDYTVNNLRDNRTGSYENYEIGFTFDVNPKFKTCRTLLRIHPDGGVKGTEGCIGLTGGKDTLLRFKNSLNNILKSQGSVNLNVSIGENPNRSGC